MVKLTERKITAAVDRFEEKWAVLDCDDPKLGEVLLPRRLVEGMAGEGDIILLTIKRDDRETAARRRRVAGLLKQLAEQSPEQN